MNTQDRRVRKTCKALQLSLAELLKEKELRQITVQELVDRADIHRATFYTHYQDIYDLYEKLEEQILQEFSRMLSVSPDGNYNSIYRSIIDYLRHYPAYGEMLLNNPAFNKRLTQVMEEKYMEIWLKEEPGQPLTDEMRSLTAYHLGGCMAIIQRWVENQYQEPEEAVIRLLQKVNDGFDHFIA